MGDLGARKTPKGGQSLRGHSLVTEAPLLSPWLYYPRTVPRKTKGLTATVDLVARGASRELVHDTVAVRLIAAYMADPDQALDPKAIGARIGCSEAEIRFVLASPIYSEMMREELRGLAMGLLSRGMTVIDRIICDKQTRDSDRIAAHRALLKSYEVIAKIEPVHEGLKGRESFMKMLDRLKRTTVTVTNGEPNGLRPRPRQPRGAPASPRPQRGHPATEEDH